MVAIERPAQAAQESARPGPPPPDAREVAERVWALLQLGQLSDAEAQCHAAEDDTPVGTPPERAVLLYRCGRVAEARRDVATRTRRLREAAALQPSPRVERALRPATATPPLALETLEAVRRRLGELGAHSPADFTLVDGPLAVGAHRVATFEACAEPSEVCQGALVTFGPDHHPIDALLVGYGVVPGSLSPLAFPGANARLVAMRGDLPAQLHEALFVAVRVDAGRITPVAFVHATEERPDRAARVRLEGDALMIDERPAPWDARLRMFQGAPVAASPH